MKSMTLEIHFKGYKDVSDFILTDRMRPCNGMLFRGMNEITQAVVKLNSVRSPEMKDLSISGSYFTYQGQKLKLNPRLPQSK
jgi:hypothetical protein